VPGILIAVVFTSYIPALGAGMVWDDDVFFFKNRLLQGPEALWHIWTGNGLADFLPLTLWNLWLEARVWGTHLAGYHATNVLLHALNALLLWRVLERLRVPGAFIAALLFAVHPVNVASVAWLTERKNTLSLLFYLLSMDFFFRFDEKHARHAWAASLLFFVCACLSKGSTVVLPPILLLLLWWRHGRITRRDALSVVPFFIVALAFGWLTMHFQYTRAAEVANYRPEGMVSRVAAAGWAIWFYLYKVIAPVHLLMVYPRWEVRLGVVAFLPLLAIISGLILLFRFKNKGWFVAGAYFILALGPVLGILKMAYHRYSLVADHFQYLAIIAPLAVIGASAHFFLERKSTRRFALAIVVAVVAVLCILTWQQASRYENELTLWGYNLKYNPQCWVGHYNRAVVLEATDEQAAFDEYTAALRLNPKHAKSWGNRSSIFIHHGQYDRALQDVEQGLSVEHSANLLVKRGNIYRLMKQPKAALDNYNEALSISKEAPYYYNRGALLLEMGQTAQAESDFRAALASDPQYERAAAKLASLHSAVPPRAR